MSNLSEPQAQGLADHSQIFNVIITCLNYDIKISLYDAVSPWAFEPLKLNMWTGYTSPSCLLRCKANIFLHYCRVLLVRAPLQNFCTYFCLAYNRKK